MADRIVAMADAPSRDAEGATTELVTTITATSKVTVPLHPRKPTYDELNPKSHPEEFFGPWGIAFITTTVIAVSYGLYFACNERTGCPAPWRWNFYREDYEEFAARILDWKAVAVYFGWYAYCVALWALVPGDWVEGTLMRNGKRVLYKINGVFTAVSTRKLHRRC